MSSKLKDKEELIVSLKKNYELKLLNKQEEQAKLVEKAKEEQLALINQLNSINITINRLGREVKNERSLDVLSKGSEWSSCPSFGGKWNKEGLIAFSSSNIFYKGQVNLLESHFNCCYP